MKHASFRPLLLGIVLGAALWAAGCDDPSNVGGGLIGETGGAPSLIEAPLLLERERVDEVTGSAQRVLAGTADDPLLGTIAARGYLDFAGPSSRPEGFEDSTLTGAVLRLVPDYAYGDTTATLQFTLRAMQEEWEVGGATADTSLAPIVGREIGTFSFAAGDTLVEYRLPEGWLQENRGVLRDTAFAEDFHGFELTSTSREAVIGFAASSGLRVFTEADTLSYRTSRTLTTIRHEDEDGAEGEEDNGALPDGRLLVQDGRGLAVAFDLTPADSLREASLNRLELRLPTDRDALEGDADFFRPPLQTLRLSRVTDDSTVIAVADLERSDDGVFRIPNVGQRAALQQFYQAVLLGEVDADELGRFRLEAPRSALSGNTTIGVNTLDAALLHTADADGPAPRLVLTVTSSE